MTMFPTRARERDHEDGNDIDRPDEPTTEEIEHDPFSFESVCRVVGQTDRLLRLRNRMLERSAALARDREEAENGTEMADLTNEYYPPGDTPTPEDSPQCLGWGARRGKCLNCADPIWPGRALLCMACQTRKHQDDRNRLKRIADGELTLADAREEAEPREDAGGLTEAVKVHRDRMCADAAWLADAAREEAEDGT